VIVERSWSRRTVAFASLLAWVMVIAIPIGSVFLGSIWSDAGLNVDSFTNVLTETRQWGLLRNTLLIAVGTAIASTILGTPIGFLLEYVRVPTRRWLTYALAVPLLLPPYVSAIVWAGWLAKSGVMTYGLPANVVFSHTGLMLQSLAGAILVLALGLFPIPAFAVAAALRRYDIAGEDPARLVSSRTRTALSITVPQILPAIITGAGIVFLLSLVEFTVPSLLQINVYAVEIYESFSTSYSSNEAAAMALPLIAIGGMAATLLQWYAARIWRPVSFASSQRRQTRKFPGAISLAIACWFFVLVVCIAPLATLFVQSLPLSSYTEAWLTANEEFATTLTLGVSAAAISAVMAAAMSVVSRKNVLLRRLFDCTIAGFLVSGPLIGVGLISFWNHDGARAAVYDSPAILVLAYCARFLCFAFIAAQAVLDRQPKQYHEAAILSGVPWTSRVLRIDLPVLAPTLLAVAGFVFVMSLREIDAAVLVAPPGSSTVGLRIFSLMHYGPSRLVAALCVLTSLLILLGAAGTSGGVALIRSRIRARD
jgi:iron(III) transport system permease protein